MKLEEIKHELKGYFLYKNRREHTLAKRDNEDFKLLTNDIEYRTINETFMITPKYYLLMQIQNQLLDPTVVVNDLSEVLPVIDFHIFELYDKRNQEIEKYKTILEQIKDSKSIFGRKKDFKLIAIKSSSIIDKNTKIDYYIIKDNQAVPIESALIENTDNAIEISNLHDLKNALRDNLVNQHYEKYNEQCKLWDSLN